MIFVSVDMQLKTQFNIHLLKKLANQPPKETSPKLMYIWTSIKIYNKHHKKTHKMLKVSFEVQENSEDGMLGQTKKSEFVMYSKQREEEQNCQSRFPNSAKILFKTEG